MNLEEKIKKYNALDLQIKNKANELKHLRDIKSSLTTNILADFEKLGIEEKSVFNNQIKIKAYQYKSASPLTFSYLQSCLEKIIPRANQVEQIINFIKSNRTFKVIHDIKKIN